MDELRPEPHHLAIGSLRVNAWRQKKKRSSNLGMPWRGMELEWKRFSRAVQQTAHTSTLFPPLSLSSQPKSPASSPPCKDDWPWTLPWWLATSINFWKTLWYGINITGLLVDLHNWCMDHLMEDVSSCSNAENPWHSEVDLHATVKFFDRLAPRRGNFTE